MPHIGAANPENDIGSDIGGMIGNALETARNHQATHGLMRGLRLLLDHLQQVGLGARRGDQASQLAGYRSGRHSHRARSRKRQHARQQLEYVGGAQLAGIVLGARVPVILNSRADTAETRLTSCAVACLLHYDAPARNRIAIHRTPRPRGATSIRVWRAICVHSNRRRIGMRQLSDCR
jgi:hypothetical protein